MPAPNTNTNTLQNMDTQTCTTLIKCTYIHKYFHKNIHRHAQMYVNYKERSLINLVVISSNCKLMKHHNPISDKEWQKISRTSFSHVTATNVGIIPQNFVTFRFKLLTTLV